MTGDQLDDLIGVAIGVFAVAVIMRGGQARCGGYAKPPAANVILQPPQNMAIGLFVALLAAGFLAYGLFR